MSLEQYLVSCQSRANICFDCKRAVGDCSWSELDPQTGKPRFEPVPGWTAKPSTLYRNERGKRGKHEPYSWRVIACPIFIRESAHRKVEKF